MVDNRGGDLDRDCGCATTVLHLIKHDASIYAGSTATFCGLYMFLYHWLTYSSNPTWFTGYAVVFFLAGLYSLCSYARFAFATIMDVVQNVQYSTLATTAGGEAFALARERRACCARPERSTREDTFLLAHDGHEPTATRSFWFFLTALLLTYNSIHLATASKDGTFPLFLSAPAIVIYFGIVRCLYIYNCGRPPARATNDLFDNRYAI